MMRAMKRTPLWANASHAALLGFSLVSCGQSKGADSPGTCPPDTVLRGQDCVPAEGESSEHHRPAKAEPGDESLASGSDTADEAPAKPSGHRTISGPTPYDKDAVEAELKRGARQVKANCGAATDDDGKASGPWGSTTASIMLGRNGHVKQVSLPAPYDGKPVGVCVVHAFDKIQFPPYAGDSDVVVDWDVQLVRPKH
jgi:hypothetical protein